MAIKDFFKRKKKVSNDYSTEGNLLVLPRCESSLPLRCIYCNAPVEKLIRIKVHGFEDAVDGVEVGGYFFFIGALMVFFINPIINLFTKKTIVSLGICQKHKMYRLIKKIMGFILMAIALILIFIVADVNNRVIVLPIGIILIITSLFFLMRAQYFLKIIKVDSQFVYIKGCGKVFLDSLVNEDHKASQ